MMSWLTLMLMPILKMLKLMLNDIVMRYWSVFFNILININILIIFCLFSTKNCFWRWHYHFLVIFHERGDEYDIKCKIWNPCFTFPPTPSEIWPAPSNFERRLEMANTSSNIAVNDSNLNSYPIFSRQWLYDNWQFSVRSSYIIRMIIVITMILMMMFTQNTMIHTYT